MLPLDLHMNPLALRRLRTWATSWGGAVLLLESSEYGRHSTRRGYSEAPFSHIGLGVKHTRFQVLLEAPLSEHMVSEVIHEMGHVFACRKRPDQSDEYDFLGWEMAMAIAVNLPTAAWRQGNKYYQVETRRTNSFDEIGRLSGSDYEALVVDRMAHARKLRLIDESGLPCSVR